MLGWRRWQTCAVVCLAAALVACEGADDGTNPGGGPGDGDDGSVIGPGDDGGSGTGQDGGTETDAGPGCGNGVLDDGEACDDGDDNSDEAPNSCRTDCTAPRCGDNVVDEGEACDNGDQNADDAPDACRTTCVEAACGDGVVDEGEACDNGDQNADDAPDACRTTCVEAACGDGVVDEGEACDNGDQNADDAPDACRTTCVEAACGDGVVDEGEACDDGDQNADDAPDACRTTCVAAICGDGVIDEGETCDDGDANSSDVSDACRLDCQPARCGDGVVDEGETCDDGDANSDDAPNACRTTCVPAGCGDNVVDEGEACDNGDQNADDAPNACRTTCVDFTCGDGVIDEGETCDNGDDNADDTADACRTTCIPARCGDGVVDDGEICDNGDQNSDDEPNACRTTCVMPACGDGVVDENETCDDGDDNSDEAPNACRATCVPAGCGDDVIDEGEACDNGEQNSDETPDACRTTCVAPTCGDNVVDEGEACDSGDQNDDDAPNACRTTCVEPTCGDGIIDEGETCDDADGNDNFQPNACRTTCVPAGCGDDVIDEGEICDDGDQNSDETADTCRTTCVPASCGDGVIDDGEACDSGEANADDVPDACRTTCAAPTCGDGVIDPSNDELCDDAAQNDNLTPNACRETCRPAGCGDNVIDDNETCDDGQQNSDEAVDACRSTCVRAFCGDGVIDDGEICDDADLNSDEIADACRTDCRPASCGDGVIDDGEACDNAALNDDEVADACRSDCRDAFCGDGVVDQAETCDDAAQNDDETPDACRTDCAPARCGDGVVDPSNDELCDDGVENNGDQPNACRATCRPASCGDGVIDDGEECDDAGNNSDDQSDACRTDCRTARCGDGVIDDGEQCDDAIENADVADACRITCQLPACGDGIVDDGEQCDDREANNDDDPNACRTTCQAPGCGDGVVDDGETCDDGEANSADVPNACRLDCAPARCGDGVIDESEECDDSIANNDDDANACRTTCALPSCGDNVTDDGEECDDGEANNNGNADACRVACVLPSCGDGTVDEGETCDDGDANDDELPNACRITCTQPRCGDGVTDEGEQCDDGDANGDVPDGCRANCELPRCGDGVIDPSNDEVCDNATDNDDFAPDACRTNCAPARCGDNVVDSEEQCDDGLENNDDAPNVCRTTCKDPSCGDGVTDLGEACDDGLDNSDEAPDACRTTCRSPRCGDGVIDSVEQCDDAAENNDEAPDTCRTNCRVPSCGDGVVDPGNDETCDDGNANNDFAPNACRTTCQAPRCGDGVLDNDEACDEGEANSDDASDACRSDCALPSCGDGTVDARAGETCDAGDANDDQIADACRTNCRTAFCGDGVVDPSNDEICDDGGANSDGDSDACRTSCQPASCGDGVVDLGLEEKCDDGANNADDRPNVCRTNCEFPACGDGVLDVLFDEACDDGDANRNDVPNACRLNCRLPRCGDGTVDADESCDDGNNLDGDECNRDCRLAGGECGDGVLNPGEECDDGLLLNDDEAPDACRTTCKLPKCGDGIVDPTNDEQCDEGDANSDDEADVCRRNCQLPSCGDGVADPSNGEACDDGGANSNVVSDACRTDCQPAHCGDGVTDVEEECDDGNTDDGDGCNAECVLEPGICGDGHINAGETCDDGDLNSDIEPNACRTDCQPARCGDGITDANEGCDDANADPFDGCLADCTVAVGICGDGVLNPGEACDDNNNDNGDGCSANCVEERGNVCALAFDFLAEAEFDPATGTMTVIGALDEFTDNLDSPCANAAGGREVFYAYALGRRADLIAETHEVPQVQSQTDTILTAQIGCGPDNVVACDNDSAGNLKSRVEVNDVRPGTTVTFAVHGFGENSVGPFVLAVRERPILDEGEVCDVDRELNRCDAGLLCIDMNEGLGICQLATPPDLTSTKSFRFRADALRVFAEGTDPDFDVVGAVYSVFDADGASVDADGDGVPDEVFTPFAVPVDGIDPFATYFEAFDPIFATAVALDVTLVDGSGLRSNTLLAPIRDLPIRAVDEECDPQLLRDACVLGADCVDSDNGSTCVPSVGFLCDAPIDIATAGQPEGNGFRVRSTFDGGNPQGEGSCGGTGPARYFEFTAPGRVDIFARIEAGFSDDISVYALDGCGGEELACGTGTGTVEIDGHDLVPGSTYIVVADAHDPNARSQFDLIVRFRPIRALGEICDPDGVADACEDGADCSPSDGEFRCDSPAPPILLDAQGFRLPRGDRIRISAIGDDPNANFERITGELLGFDGIAVDVDGDGASDTVEFEIVSIELDGPTFAVVAEAPVADASIIEAAVVRAIDRSGLASEDFLTPLDDLPVRELGEPCDPERITDACGPATACSETGDGPLCVPVPGFDCDTAIDMATEGTIEGCGFATFRFLDPNPEIDTVELAGNFNNWGIDQPLDPMRRDPEGMWVVSQPLDPGPHPYKFVVTIAGVPTFVEDPTNPNRADDGFGGFNSVIDVPPCNAPAVFTVRGQTFENAADTRGTCGGNGREVYHRFVMPFDGDLVIDTVGDLARPIDTIVHVRAACDAAESELDCNDDGAGNLRSRVELLDLAAGTELQIIVDTYNADQVGEYQLNAAAAPRLGEGDPCVEGEGFRCPTGLRCIDGVCADLTPPSLEFAEVYRDRDLLRVFASGFDPDSDVAEVVVVLYDVNSIPIDVDADGQPDRFALPIEGATGEPNYDGFAELGGLAPETLLAADSVGVTVVDASGFDSETVRAPIAQLPLRTPGEACDPDALRDRCVEPSSCDGGICTAFAGLDCRAPARLEEVGVFEPDSRMWRLDVTIGDANSANEIGSCGGDGAEYVIEYTVNAPMALEISTDDFSNTLDTVLYTRIGACDAAGEEIACNDDASAFNRQSVIRTAVFEPGTTLWFFVDTKLPGEHDSILLTVQEIPVLDLGAPCDPTGARTICNTGLRCVDLGTGPTCEPGVPPELTDALALRLDADSIRLIADGFDNDGDATGLAVTLLDGNGAPLFDDVVPFAPPPPAGAPEFRGAAVIDGVDAAAVVEALVSAVDATGLRSQPLLVPVDDIVQVPSGAACDPAELVDACEPGSRCLDDGQGGFACTPIAGLGCVAAIDLAQMGQAEANTLRYEGDNTLNRNELVGSCHAGNANGNDATHMYTVGERADVIVTTIDPFTSFDTVLSVRRACDDAESEIGCNDDTAGANLRSRVELNDVEAGTPLWIIVDAYSAAGSGSYALLVTEVPLRNRDEPCDPQRLASRCLGGLTCADPGNGPICGDSQAPSIDDATALRLGDNEVRVIVDGTDIDRDTTTLIVRPLDADGAPIDLDGDGAPDDIEATPLTAPDGLDVFTLAADVDGLPIDVVVRLELVLIDAVGNEASTIIDVVPIPERQLDDNCDIERLHDRCVAGARCTDVDGSGLCTPIPGYACDEAIPLNLGAERQGNTFTYFGDNRENAAEIRGACAGNGREVFHQFVLPERADIAIRTDLPETDFDTVLYVHDDCADLSEGSELVCDDEGGNNNNTSRVELTDVGTGTLLVVVVDGYAATSLGQYGLAIELIPIRELNQACDPAGVETRCEPGLACVDDGNDGGVCVGGTPPVIDGVEVYRDPRNGDLRAIVTGEDVEGDVAGARLFGFDPNGEPIVLGDEGFMTRLFAGPIPSGPFEAPVVFDGLVDDLSEVDLVLFDRAGYESAPFRAPIDEFLIVGNGEPCDEMESRNACEDGFECTDSGDGFFCVSVSAATCAAAIDVDIEGVRDGDAIRYIGDTTGLEARTRGSCPAAASSGPEVALVYTPMNDSILEISTVSDATVFDTVVYVRNVCGDPATELACDDDAPGIIGPSLVGVRAFAGQPVFIFVDGFSDNRFGQYELIIRELTVLGPGEPCDASAPIQQCDDGLVCGVTSVCERDLSNARPPVIFGAEAFDVDGELIRVFFDGADPDADAFRLMAEPINQGDPGVFFEAQLLEPFEGLDSFSGAAELLFPAGTNEINLYIEDFAGLTSEIITIPVMPFAERVIGEPCDPSGLRDRCTEGLCGDGANGPECAWPGQFACDNAAPLEQVALFDPGRAVFTYNGFLDPTSFEHEGSCGGGGPEQVFQVTMPVRAALEVTTGVAGSPFPTLLYVRGDCLDPDSELACTESAGVAGQLQTGPIDADATVFLFVDSHGDNGPFDLEVRFLPVIGDNELCDPEGSNICDGGLRCADVGADFRCLALSPPTPVGALALVTADRVRVIVQGQDLDADAEGLEVALFAGGAPQPYFVERGAFDPAVRGQLDFMSKVDFFGVDTTGLDQIVAAIFDAGGLSSQAFVVDIQPLPVRNVGEACDPDGIFDDCIDGLPCNDQGNGPICVPVDGFGCNLAVDLDVVGEGDPTLRRYLGNNFDNAHQTTASCIGDPQDGAEVVHVYTSPGFADVIFTTEDDVTDFDTVIYVRTDCADEGSEVGCNDDSGPDQRSTVEVRNVQPGQPLFAFVDAVSSDRRGQYALTARARFILPDGAACDPAAFANRCEDGFGCIEADGESTCRELQPPEITGGRVLLADDDLLRFVVDTLDGDADVVGMSALLFDNTGAIIDVFGDGMFESVQVPLIADPFGVPHPQLVGELRFAAAPTVFSAEVVVYDAQGQVTVPFLYHVDAIPVVDQGGACDIEGIFDRCTDGNACQNVGFGPICAPVPGYTCDGPVPLNLAAAIDGNLYTYNGNNRRNDSALQGSCGGAGREVYHAFVSPEHAALTISTARPETTFDTVLYAIADCAALGDPGNERACNDDFEGTPSRIELREVQQGETVLLVVDGYGSDSVGEYGLEIRVTPLVGEFEPCDPNGEFNRCEPGFVCDQDAGTLCLAGQAPQLDGFEAWRSPFDQSTHVIVTGTDPDDDAVGAHLLGFSPGGEPIGTGTFLRFDPAPAGPGPFEVRIDLGFIAPEDIAELEAYIVDTAGLESAPLRSVISDLDVLPFDAVCDPSGLRAICEPGAACRDTGDGFRCRPDGRACEAAVDLNVDGDLTAEGLRFVATTAGLPNTLDAGCAPADGGEGVFIFTAGVDSVVEFTTDSPSTNLDAVLSIRDVCDDFTSDLACESAGAASTAHVPMAGGQSVFVLVDGIGPDGGDFELFVRPFPIAGPGEPCQPDLPFDTCIEGFFCDAGTCQAERPVDAPNLLNLEAYTFSADVLRVFFEVQDPNADVDELGVQVFNDLGEVMPFQGSLAGEFIGIDPFSTFVDLPVPQDFGAVEIIAHVVDQQGFESLDLRAPVQPFPEGQIGEACDEQGFFNRCAVRGVCVAGVCEVDTVPVLTASQIYDVGPGTLRIFFSGYDGDGNIDGVRIEIVDVNGEVIAGDVSFGGGVLGMIEFDNFFFNLTGLGDGFQPELVRFRLLDADGQQSNQLEVPVEQLPTVGVGDACDPLGNTDRCVAGAVCVDTGVGSVACVAGNAPALLDVEAYQVDADSVRLIFRVHDPDANVDGVAATFRDAAGGELPLAGNFGGAFVGQVNVFSWGDFSVGDFVAEAVDVQFNDQQGFTSNIRSVPVMPFPQRGLGEICNLAGVFDRCEDGADCVDDGQGTGFCQQGATPRLLDVEVFARTDGSTRVVFEAVDGDGNIDTLHAEFEPIPGTPLSFEQPLEGEYVGQTVISTFIDLAGQLSPVGTPVTVRVADLDGQQSNAVDTVIVEFPIRAPVEACDPRGFSDACVGGFICLTGPDQTATCQPDIVPFLDNAQAFDIGGGFIRIVFEGTDNDANVDGLRVELRDDVGETDLRDEGFGGALFGQADFRSGIDIEVPPGFTAIDATVSLFDADGQQSNPLDLVIEPFPIRQPGQACDPQRLSDACTPETLCVPDGNDGNFCDAVAAPVLDSTQVFDLDNGSVRVFFRVRDLQGDVDGILVTLDDGAGNSDSQQINFDGQLVGLPEIFTFLEVEVPPGLTPVLARVQVIDQLAQFSNELEVPVEPLPARALGETCDAQGFFDRCVGGSQCIDDGGAAICVSETAPVLLSAAALITAPGALRIVFEATDSDTNIDGIEYTIFDDTGAPLPPESIGFGGAFIGVESVRSGVDVTFPDALVIIRVEVRLTDAIGEASNQLDVPVEPMPVRADGEVCDPTRLYDRCELGTTCGDDGQGGSICLPSTAPVLQAAELYVLDPLTMRVFFQFFDSDGNVDGLRVELVDDVGAATPYDFNFGGGLDHTPGLNLAFNLPIEAGNAVIARITLVDLDGQPSNTIEVPVLLFPERALGDACDPGGVFDRCVGDLECVDPGDGTSTCTQPEHVVINELFYDAVGSDSTAAFTELYGPPGFVLDGWTLVGYSEDTVDPPYRRVSLDGMTIPASGYLVIIPDNVNHELWTLAIPKGNVDWQNGPDDAVQLRDPNDTIVDAVHYGDVSYGRGEGEPAVDPPAGQSITRYSDSGDSNDNATDFVGAAPTPGAPGPARPPLP